MAIIPIAFGSLCQFIYVLFVNIEQFNKKTVGMALASVLAAILNYILNFIFIPKYGYIAAAYTTLIGYLFLLFAHMYLVWKQGCGKAFYYKEIFLIIIVMFGITALINFTYIYNILRYILIGVFACIFIYLLYRKREILIIYVKKRWLDNNKNKERT